MKKNYILILIFSLIFLDLPSYSALTANSTNYYISLFGQGFIASSKVSSENYSAQIVSIATSSTRASELLDYRVNLGYFGDTSYFRTVSISSYTIYPKNTLIGSTIKLSLSALNSQTIWAKITSPNDQIQILSLINNAEVNYLPSPSVVGRYNITFYANDSSGALATATDYFELTSPAPKTENTISSGSSETIVIKECSYNWDCTPWSLCSEGKQQRECKNIGTCEGIENRPIEKTECSSALFDLNIHLGNLDSNKGIVSFNITLEEQKGAEKFDVLIKYSLIDKNSQEIFSEIETRAVEGTINYKKELENLNLSCGNYTLRTEILYGNLQRAIAEKNIQISENCVYEPPSSTSSTKISSIILKVFFFGGVLVVLNLIFLLFLKKRSKKSFYNKNLKKISKNKSFKKEGKFTKEKKTRKYRGKTFSLRNLFKKIFRKKLIIPQDSLSSLKNKEVYLENGQHIGKVEEIFLGKDRINSLKIKLNKKYKHINKKGIILNYHLIKSVSEIIILDLSCSHLFKK